MLYPVECTETGFYLRLRHKHPRRSKALGAAVQHPHVVDAMEIDQGSHLHLPVSLLPPSDYQSPPRTVTKATLPHKQTPANACFVSTRSSPHECGSTGHSWRYFDQSGSSTPSAAYYYTCFVQADTAVAATHE